MYSFPTQMRKMSDFWSWVDNTMITSLRAGPWYNGDQPYGQRGYLHDRVSRLMGYAVMRQVRIIKSKKICILHGFPCEINFSHHESPNPTRVACDQGGIRRQVVRNTSRMENHTKCILCPDSRRMPRSSSAFWLISEVIDVFMNV